MLFSLLLLFYIPVIYLYYVLYVYIKCCIFSFITIYISFISIVYVQADKLQKALHEFHQICYHIMLKINISIFLRFHIFYYSYEPVGIKYNFKKSFCLQYLHFTRQCLLQGNAHQVKFMCMQITDNQQTHTDRTILVFGKAYGDIF